MSFDLTLSELVEITQGQLLGSDVSFNELCTDSRKIKPSQVFLALSGENFDGHVFCQQVVEKGASALIVERQLDLPVSQLVVADCHQALGKIAAYNRSKYQGSVIAVTGSNGKTTTKEIIASILAQKGTALATLGNLNNDIGVPLTLLRFDATHQYSVIEMGANAKGEIAYCTALAKPDVALITNAMGAHLEGFGSLQGVVEAKAEIFQGLPENGTAVLNLDDKNVAQWQVLVEPFNVITFSLSNPEADVYASNVEQLAAGNYRFRLHFKQQSEEITLALLGLHNVQNALAAAATVFAIDGSFDEIVKGIETANAIAGRLKAMPGINQSIVIDDSYNGNPDSVKAGIELLAQLSGVKILALGDMAELGSDELAMHSEIGAYAADKGIDYLLSSGPKSALAAQQFVSNSTKQALAFDGRDELISKLKTMMNKDTKVLVKGSLSAGMKQVVSELTQGEI